MPVIPLFDAAAHADGSHHVTSPGGYEWWYFDAEDAAGKVRFIAVFFDGYPFHPDYLRRFERYLRHPTTTRPPIAAEYPGVYFALCEEGEVTHQRTTRYPQGSFQAARDRPEVRVGGNWMSADADGVYRLHLEGTPCRRTWFGRRQREGTVLRADFTFSPTFRQTLHEEGIFQASASRAVHRWAMVSPRCEVEGTINIDASAGGASNGAARRFAFRGRGYHDHHYGAGPIGAAVDRWMWGRILTPDRAIVFHVARSVERGSPDKVRLIEQDVTGTRVINVSDSTIGWKRFTAAGLAYPAEVCIGPTLRLSAPRLVDATHLALRLLYDARIGGAEETALCEIVYPRRLTLPILRRFIEKPIQAFSDTVAIADLDSNSRDGSAGYGATSKR